MSSRLQMWFMCTFLCPPVFFFRVRAWYVFHTMTQEVAPLSIHLNIIYTAAALLFGWAADTSPLALSSVCPELPESTFSPEPPEFVYPTLYTLTTLVKPPSLRTVIFLVFPIFRTALGQPESRLQRQADLPILNWQCCCKSI